MSSYLDYSLLSMQNDLEIKTIFSDTTDNFFKLNSYDRVWQNSLIESFKLKGEEYLEDGKIKEASKTFQSIIDILETLIKSDPANITIQKDLSIYYKKLAQIEAMIGDTKSAQELYQKSSAFYGGTFTTDNDETLFWINSLNLLQYNLYSSDLNKS